jgi:uncharacterized membrane protein YhhN
MLHGVMPTLFSWGVAITILGVAALLVAQWQEHRLAARISKPIASAGFLLAALGADALDSSYGRVMMVGLIACAAGDVLLMFTSTRVFLAGIGAFALGHMGFAAAFYLRGVTPWASVVALVLLVPFGRGVRWWLEPYVEGTMKKAVAAYIVIISSMVALAIGTHVREPSTLVLVGALSFFLSDLAVARERFVAPGFVNRLWGLPLYYGAQLLLAASILA